MQKQHRQLPRAESKHFCILCFAYVHSSSVHSASCICLSPCRDPVCDPNMLFEQTHMKRTDTTTQHIKEQRDGTLYLYSISIYRTQLKIQLFIKKQEQRGIRQPLFYQSNSLTLLTPMAVLSLHIYVHKRCFKSH